MKPPLIKILINDKELLCLTPHHLLMLFAERGQFYGVPAPGAMVSLEVQDEHDRRVWAYPMPDLSDEDEGAR